jgi:hypothetical protein
MNTLDRTIAWSRGRGGMFWVAAASAAMGLVLGLAFGGRRPLPVHAIGSLAQDSFAVCTTPLEPGIEALFILDFETGDLSGGAINANTQKFSPNGYRYNVLNDLGFKKGKVKSPKFLLVAGGVAMAGNAATQLAQSVLYVTDVTTGVTAAYAIPVQGPNLVLLDVVKPRGGKP